ncbi:MAG: bacteriohemerythrin [Magnetococcales bacterium]|nr:bacteriohemerythrin [Magnetococcales bacterium]
MKNSAPLLERYVEQTSRALLLVDEAGTVAFCNGKLTALLNWSDGDSPVGQPFDRFLAWLAEVKADSFLDLGQTAEALRRSLALGHPFREEDFLLAERWLSLCGRPLEGGGYALTLTNVTTHHTTMETLRRSSRTTVMALAELAESRDQTTGEHVLRVARATHEIARKLRDQGRYTETIDGHFLQNIALASILHDIGKVTTPDRILLKPGPLDPEERQIIQQHSEVGRKLLTRLNDFLDDDSYLAMSARIAGAHHEKFAGGGYPEGVADQSIPLEGRIVALADVFDALISERPYKQAWSEAEAVDFLQKESGRMFDPWIVEAFLEVLEDRKKSHKIVWTPEMTVGDRMLDFDHRNLVSLLNQVHRSLEQRDFTMFDLVLQELFNYTLGHFNREEAYLNRMGYPHREPHAAIHRGLTQKVREMRQRLYNANARQELGEELMELLSTWLKDHILREDGQYFRYAQRLDAAQAQVSAGTPAAATPPPEAGRASR